MKSSYKEIHVSKFSKTENIVDLIHTLLYSFNPYITTNFIRYDYSKFYNGLEKEVIMLLLDVKNFEEESNSYEFRNSNWLIL